LVKKKACPTPQAAGSAAPVDIGFVVLAALKSMLLD
jgi:hypothetical protein